MSSRSTAPQNRPLYNCSVISVVDANVYSLATENFPQSPKNSSLLYIDCEMWAFKGLLIIKPLLICIPLPSLDKGRFPFDRKFPKFPEFGDGNECSGSFL